MKRYMLLVVGIFFGPVFADSLDSLATALKDLARDSKPQYKDEGLLGPWLVKNHPEKLVAYDENYQGTGIKIYQLKVAQQKSLECDIHGARNVLYLIDMLKSPRKDFKTIYKNMVSVKGFEEFVTLVGCPRETAGDYFPDIRKALENKKITCMPTCIPQRSIEYLKNIIKWTDHNELYSDNEVDPSGKKQQERRKDLGRIIQPKDPLFKIINIDRDKNDRTIRDASALSIYSGFNSETAVQMKALASHNEYVLGVKLSVWTGMGHAVALVIHKYDNKIEYLFADSIGGSFKTAENYRAALDTIIAFTQNYQYYQHSLIRFAAYEFLAKDALNVPRIQFMTEVGLFDTEFYRSAYKEPFCGHLQYLKSENKGSNLDEKLKLLGCV